MDYQEAITCATLCNDIYQDFATIKFQDFPYVKPVLIEDPETDTQCAILAIPNSDGAYIVFRGSDKKTDWDTNLDWKQQAFNFRQNILEKFSGQEKTYPYGDTTDRAVEMHRGFVSAYLSVREQIHQHIQSQNYASVMVMGHSLGGAIATLCVLDLQYNFFSPETVKLYTFGSPRVGNTDFRTSFSQRVPQSHRVVNGMDIVSALPRPWQGYRHIDQEYRVGQRFSLRFITQRFRDHEIAMYIDKLKQRLS